MLTPLGACRARTQTSAVVKSGFLDKKSRRYRTYSRYWFVLRGDRLTYYYDAQVQPCLPGPLRADRWRLRASAS